MSIHAIAWAFEQDCTPTSKLVLLKLADNANDNGYCWPSQSTLSRHTGLARESISRNIRKLERQGLLKVIRRKQEGTNLPNHYQLCLTPPCKNDPPCDAESHTHVTQNHTEPSVEPSVNTRTPKKKVGTPLPADFGITDGIRKWAREKGHTNLADHMESFKLKAQAKDYRYVDWEAAFKTAVRDNWAGIKPSTEPPQQEYLS